jgi:hypothetical protein
MRKKEFHTILSQYSMMVELSRKLESERNNAQNLLKQCLSVIPVGYIPTHIVENLPEMIGNLTSAVAEETAQCDKLAEALEDIRARCQDKTIEMHPDSDAKGCVDDCLEWSEQALAAVKGEEQ